MQCQTAGEQWGWRWWLSCCTLGCTEPQSLVSQHRAERDTREIHSTGGGSMGFSIPSLMPSCHPLMGHSHVHRPLKNSPPRTHRGDCQESRNPDDIKVKLQRPKEKKKNNRGGGGGMGERQEKKGKYPHTALQMGSAAPRCPRATCQSN